MRCPQCGSKTRVTTTRSVEAGKDKHNNVPLKMLKAIASDWYVYRRRACDTCVVVHETVEILFDELQEAKEGTSEV